MALSFLVLRMTKPNMPRPFRVKNGILIGVLATIMAGFMAVMYIIPGTSCSLIWQEWIIVGGWILVGLILAFRAKKIYQNEFCSGMDLN